MPYDVKCSNCYYLKNDWCIPKMDSPDPDILRDCQYFITKANADRIRTMPDKDLAVGNLSGADVVEVVRCKDCRHRPFSTEPGETSGFAVEAPDCICPCYNPDDGYYSWVPNDDFFCADGERKEGDND